MRHLLAEPDERAVVLGEPSRSYECADRGVTQPGENLLPEDFGIGSLPCPGADSLLVGGVLGATELGGATTVRRVLLFLAESSEHGGGAVASSG